MGDEEADGIQVVSGILGKGVHSAHQAAEPGSQGAKEAFNVAGFALFFAAATVGSLREGNGVGAPGSRCGSHNGGSPAAALPADHKRFAGFCYPASKPRSGGCVGTGPPTARTGWPGCPQSSRVRQATTRRLAGRAGARPRTRGGCPLSPPQPLDDRLVADAKGAVDTAQAQAVLVGGP